MLIFVTLKSIDKAMMLSLQQLKATEEERVPKMIQSDTDGNGSDSPSQNRTREAINDKGLRESYNRQALDENGDWNAYGEGDGHESEEGDGEGNEETAGGKHLYISD